MLGILNFFLGWVLIEVRGAYIERFFNLCSQNQINFWGMERVAPDLIKVRVRVSNYRKLRQYAKKAMCRLHIVSKHGLPFFTVRFKKRGILIAGLMVFAAIAWVLTSFVWVIDISGCSGEEKEKLEKYLEENGVYIGSYVPRIDISNIKNEILIKMPELIYVGVNITGSHADVHVRKRVDAPQVESEKDDPCSIVARRGGIITSVVVQSGTQEVQKGDTVTEGQLLASSYMTGRTGTTVVTRAKAQVRARTWYTVTSLFPMKTDFKTYTGRERRRKTLVFSGRRLKLYGNSRIPYEECDKIIKTTVLTLPWDIRLPVALETETFKEYVTESANIPPETALEYLSEGLENVLILGSDGKVLDRRYTAGFKGNVARVTMTAECEEEIGVEQKIPKGE